MKAKWLRASLLGLIVIGLVAASSFRISGQAGAAPAIDNDDIGGIVTGEQGPEAGVWVIAETRTTPTHLIKSVVTDDRGRFVVPDLPRGNTTFGCAATHSSTRQKSKRRLEKSSA